MWKTFPNESGPRKNFLIECVASDIIHFIKSKCVGQIRYTTLYFLFDFHHREPSIELRTMQSMRLGRLGSTHHSAAGSMTRISSHFRCLALVAPCCVQSQSAQPSDADGWGQHLEHLIFDFVTVDKLKFFCNISRKT